jgi:hypothetical protein
VIAVPFVFDGGHSISLAPSHDFSILVRFTTPEGLSPIALQSLFILAMRPPIKTLA